MMNFENSQPGAENKEIKKSVVEMVGQANAGYDKAAKENGKPEALKQADLNKLLNKYALQEATKKKISLRELSKTNGSKEIMDIYNNKSSKGENFDKSV